MPGMRIRAGGAGLENRQAPKGLPWFESLSFRYIPAVSGSLDGLGPILTLEAKASLREPAGASESLREAPRAPRVGTQRLAAATA